MAVIEVCDICRREASKENGITVNYKVRICDKCKENIIKYCKKNAR